MAAIKLLVPVDGSSRALKAVDYVVQLSAKLREPPQVLLLNVQWNVAVANVKLFISRHTINEYHLERGMAALSAARAILHGIALPYQYHISVGTPAEAIVLYASQQNADQIIMVRHTRGCVQSLLLGSVVNKVLQTADCPVLLVR